MKNIIIILVFFFAQVSFAQKDIYESPKFNELSKDHKELAILPFFTNLDLEKTLSKEEKDALEQKEGYAVQDALEIYFSQPKKKKKFTVDFQNTKTPMQYLLRTIYPTKTLIFIASRTFVIY